MKLFSLLAALIAVPVIGAIVALVKGAGDDEGKESDASGATTWPAISGTIGSVLWRGRETAAGEGGYTVEVNASLGFGTWKIIGKGWDADEVVPGVERWIEGERAA